MSQALIFRRQAEFDLDDIENYYNKISSNLTNAFFIEFFETLTFIEQDPLLFQSRYREVRIAPLYKFPYGVHYYIKGNEVIVLRVLHSKRYFK